MATANTAESTNETSSRVLFLHDNVNGPSMHHLIKEITDLNAKDDQESRQLQLKNPGSTFVRAPIILDINTRGGLVGDGIALISCIEQSRTPVITRVNGYAYSMGIMIFLAGKERLISRHARLMYHQISSMTGGTIREQEEDVDASLELLDRLENYVVERTNWKKKTLKKIYKLKKDYFLYADEALAAGFATRIV